MGKYVSSDGHVNDTGTMATQYIINAIAKLEREGFISCNHHRRAFAFSGYEESRKRIPNKNLDALREELEKRTKRI